ncbi:MAG: hypothetical protein NTV55_10620 [Planctomycetota bacterium]|nr:hypothetical protein [Planctomycetota bacterium]
MKALPIENVTARGFLSLDNYANLSAAHAWTDAGQFRSWLFIGVLGANSSPSVLVKVQQAKDILGTGVKDIPGKSYTHADAATGQRIVLINLLNEELDTALGYRFARLRVEVTGGTTTQMTGLMLGCDPRFGRAQDDKLAEVLAVVD